MIKFNGVNHKAKFGEKKSLNERKPKVNVSSWDEKRSAEKEIAAAKEEREEEDFSWVLPDDPKVVINESKKKRKNTPSTYFVPAKKKSDGIKKLISIIFLAMVIGIGFGFIALQFFSKEPSQLVNGTVNTMNTEKAVTENESSTNPSPNTTIDVPLVVLQEGIYSKESGADSVVSELKTSGYAAGKFASEKGFFVFIGVASSSEEGKALKQVVLDDAIREDAYDKSISVELQADEESSRLIQELAELSASALKTKSPISDEKQAEITELLNGINGQPEPLKESVELLKNDSITKEQLWQVQQKILSYLAEHGKLQN